MKIQTTFLDDGTIVCETETPRRNYRSRYRGYSIIKARRLFRARVEKAEQEELDKVRMKAILMCLDCKIPVEKCKGKCRYKPANGKKVPRGKRSVL